MVVDKVADMVVKVPNEDFTDMTLTIDGDIHGDYVRGGEGGGRWRTEQTLLVDEVTY